MAYTDLTAMRNDFLAKTQSKLLAKDFATATENDLIIAGAMVRAFDSVNNFDPISNNAVSFLTSVGSLQTYLADPSNRQAFESILSSSTAMPAVAASSTAMTAVAASSTAMTAVAASSTAMTAVAANSTAFATVVASSTAMAAVAANSTAFATVMANSTAFATVVASSTAMAAVAASKTALAAIWGKEAALSAIRSNQSAIDTLVASSFTVYLSNAPSSLQSTQVSTKCILLKSRNTGGSDTNYVRTRFSNGGSLGDWSYNTSSSFSNQVQAFQNFQHCGLGSNYTWQGYVIDCD